MRGKVVVITGATSGLGQAAALGLARRGARMVFTARDGGRAANMLAALNDAGPGQAHRYVLGAWYEQGSYLRWDMRGIEAVSV